MNIQLPQIAPGASATGEMSFQDVTELRKALEAGYGTDVSTLAGGGALRIQSLDKTMMSTIQENDHFALFNELQKSNATATVDEWTEQSSVGGFLGGSTNTETGTIASAQGVYNRRVGLVKYMMTRREVSFVQTLQNTIADSEATEQANGALQLLTDAEFLCFEGDDTVVPTEFPGIYTQIADGVADGVVDGSNLLDAEGKSLASIDLINKAAATVSAYGNFGKPSHIFMSQLTQSDFDTGLDPAFRVSLSGTGQDIMLGAPVIGIRTSWGNIKTKPDIFVRDEAQMKPFEVDFPTIAAANDTFKPTLAAVKQAGGADSKWGATHAGMYYYMVAGVNAQGQSTGAVSSQITVAAGEQVQLTITRSAGAKETGYAIYRGRKDGTNAPADMRLVTRIPVAGATTVWVDKNRKIPGTTKAYILDMRAGQNAITWRQLLPMLKFPLYPTVSAVVPWAQLLFGFLRIAKRRHHAIIENILPDGAQWRPFN